MTHLGWFFAGTSLGLFLGVLLTFLARIEDVLREQRVANEETGALPKHKLPKKPFILARH